MENNRTMWFELKQLFELQDLNEQGKKIKLEFKIYTDAQYTI